ncbi:serine/threonine protein kinase, partial [Planctomycetota bacterium]|nr:serine/threonine protein kinase [Planctomycetota bacterium]
MESAPLNDESEQRLTEYALARGFVTKAQVEWAAQEPGGLFQTLAARVLRPEQVHELEQAMSSGAPQTGRTAADRASASAPEVPKTIGRYVIKREIARGGMGVVYEAVDAGLQRRVAIKLMLDPHGSEVDERRFQLEARATARLDHPNIVPTYEFGSDNGRPYMVMGLVEGQSLKRRLVHGPMTVPDVIRHGRALADALQHAHDAGILHRDVKPGNVLIEPSGVPRLTDFGLVKLTDAATKSLSGSMSTALTVNGQLIGTPQFMSPEQANGEVSEYDERSDVYGLGATLFALMTGEPPFAQQSLIPLINAIVRKPPRDPYTLCPDLPQSLVDVVMRCLAKDRKHRFQSAAELRDALDQSIGRTPPPARRIPVGGLAVVAAVVAVGSAGIGFALPSDGTPPDAVEQPPNPVPADPQPPQPETVLPDLAPLMPEP